MDTIKQYNDYVDRARIEHSTVVLKRQASVKSVMDYVVVGCTLDAMNEVVLKKELDATTTQNLTNQSLINHVDDVKEVLYFGKLAHFTGYHQVVSKFPQSRRNILEGKEPVFRLYTMTAEKQKEIMWLVNNCSTAQASWISAVKKVGSEYGLILKIIRKNGN